MLMNELLETKELDQRQADKLTVTLWWVKGTMDTFVTVLDTRTTPPEEFHIDVPKGVLPHAVFQHPFAYMHSPEAA